MAITLPLALRAIAAPAVHPSFAAASVDPASVEEGSPQRDELGRSAESGESGGAPLDTAQMALLKAQVKEFQKQIAAKREALAALMADDSLPAEMKRDRVRMAQQEIAALQAGVTETYLLINKLIKEGKGSLVGSQLDFRA